MTSTNYITPVYNTASASTSGDMVVFNNATGSLVSDSGILSSNLMTTNTNQSVTGTKTFDTNVNIQTVGGGSQLQLNTTGSGFVTIVGAVTPTTGSWQYSIEDVGQSASFVVSAASPAVGDIATWANTAGSLIQDSNLNVSSASTTTTLSTTTTAPILVVAAIRQVGGTGVGNSATFQAGGAQSGTTNLNGGDAIITSGIATGSGRSNIKLKQYVGTGTSGTADVAISDRMVFMGRFTLNASGTATNVVSATVATGDTMAYVIRYSIKVTGGSSDVQCETNTVTVAAYNKGGTVTGSITAGTPVQSLSAGTLTVAWSIFSASVRVTPTTSLTSPTITMVYDVDNMSSSTLILS
jgi:hypothetical protein